MKTSITVLFVLLAFQCLQSQGFDDWVYYQDSSFDTYTDGAKEDMNGNIWCTSWTRLLKYDGSNWSSYDVLDAGFSVNFLSDFEISSDGKIWIFSRYLIYEYIIATDTWIEHDVNGTLNNPTFNDIHIDAQGNVWAVSRNGLYEYDGVTWTRYNFWNNVPGIEEGTTSSFLQTSSGVMWVTTPYSTCIDSPCYTPAGAIKYDGVDTTYFLSSDIGVEMAITVNLTENEAGDIWAIVSDSFQINNNKIFEYQNGVWSFVEDIPVNGYIGGVHMGEDDKLYITMPDRMLIGQDGVWDAILIDTAKLDQLYHTEVMEDGGIYFSGRKQGSPSVGVIAYLPPLEYVLRGKVYADVNSNGIFDGMDRGMANQFVKTENNDRITITNSNGDYGLLFRDAGNYTLEALLPSYFFYLNPDDGKIDATLSTANPQVNNLDFGLQPDTSAIDLEVAHHAIRLPNPGFEFCYLININNLAPRISTGELIFSYDPMLSFFSSSATPVWINPDQIAYQINDMDWLENRQIRICFSVPPDGNLIGTDLTSTLAISTVGGTDLDVSNNFDEIVTPIVGPYDPNYIEVNPKGIGSEGEIPLATRSLIYTIHFQNIGSDTARNVLIENPIDEDLDLLSLKVIGASHDFELEYLEDSRTLQWQFDNINLVDSLTNEAGSHGFIQYRIGMENTTEGTVFNNTAAIYFDFNEAIITNTTFSTLADITTSTASVPVAPTCKYNVSQEGEFLQLSLDQFGEGTVQIYDISGRRLYQTTYSGTLVQVDISSLHGGVYVLFVDVEGCGIKEAQPFVKL